jgi:hypothetical protein
MNVDDERIGRMIGSQADNKAAQAAVARSDLNHPAMVLRHPETGRGRRRVVGAGRSPADA